MTRIMCDICGKDIPLGMNFKDTKRHGFRITIYETKLDMCKECREALYDWIINRRAECRTSDTEGMIDRIAKAGEVWKNNGTN